MIETSKRFIEMNTWYNLSTVKFQLIKSTMNREMAVLSPKWDNRPDTSIRMLKCHSVQHFDYITKEGIRMWERMIPYNFYYSLAKYRNGIPNQTFNLAERDNSAWKENHISEMSSYDFLLDIDSPSFEEIDSAYYSAARITELFDSQNVPYQVRFSGKGFHIIIPYEYFHSRFLQANQPFNSNSPDNVYRFYISIAKALSGMISEMIDLKIYDSRRIVKIPFSLSLYKDAINVCYPFQTRAEFGLFDIKIFELSNFSHDVRGNSQPIFNEHGNCDFLIELAKRGEKNEKKRKPN